MRKDKIHMVIHDDKATIAEMLLINWT